MRHSPQLFENLSVLYVEDEPFIALDTIDGLEKSGFKRLVTAMTLAEAERAIDEHHFDCAILDINLDRQQTSLELGARLRQRGTRILFASGNVMDHRSLLKQGFAFLAKPFEVCAVEDELIKLFAVRQPTSDQTKSV